MAITEFGDLTTPEQYVNYYFGQFQDELSARGLQLSKVGIVGLMMHTLGFTQYDIKQYFDTIFREAFLATADEDENIVMHGSVHGYSFSYATPAQITGDFRLDLTALPVTTNTSTRFVIEKLQITIDNMVYNLDAKYTIYTNMVQIQEPSGEIIQVPYSDSNPTIPISGLNQYETKTFEFTTSYYTEYTHYRYEISLDDNVFVNDIAVSVLESSADEAVDYEVRAVKYFTSSTEKVVFVKTKSTNTLLLETGSGVYGKYIPNATITVTVSYTYGEVGNISSQTVSPSNILVRMYDDNSGTSRSFTTKGVLDVEIDYGDGGKDALSGEELRDAVISYIRSQENLVTENDFYDLLSNYVRDFVLMFKKTHVLENHIYLFQAFRNQYSNPIRSQSISVKHTEFNPGSECYVYRPIFTLNNAEYVSPFLYIVDFVMRYYKGYLLYESIARYFNDITIEDDSTEESSIPLTLYVTYDHSSQTTKFSVTSYNDISSYVMYITVTALDINDECMQQADDSTFEYYYSELMLDTVDVKIKVYLNGSHNFTYLAEDVAIVADISDLLTLKTWEGEVEEYTIDGNITTLEDVSVIFPDDAYVLNIPIMVADEFYEDEDYYLSKIANSLGSVAEAEGRMVSDDVQIRFINTDYIESDMTKELTTQNHELDIKFPLILRIDIVGYEDYISENDINTTDDTEQLRLQLAELLYDKYTGEDCSFFRTQIVNVVHNYGWVKYCEIYVTDSTENAEYNKITNSNFELENQKTIVDNLTKKQAALFCPVYVWWDLENITINVNFE